MQKYCPPAFILLFSTISLPFFCSSCSYRDLKWYLFFPVQDMENFLYEVHIWGYRLTDFVEWRQHKMRNVKCASVFFPFETRTVLTLNFDYFSFSLSLHFLRKNIFRKVFFTFCMLSTFLALDALVHSHVRFVRKQILKKCVPNKNFLFLFHLYGNLYEHTQKNRRKNLYDFHCDILTADCNLQPHKTKINKTLGLEWTWKSNGQRKWKKKVSWN